MLYFLISMKIIIKNTMSKQQNKKMENQYAVLMNSKYMNQEKNQYPIIGETITNGKKNIGEWGNKKRDVQIPKKTNSRKKTGSISTNNTLYATKNIAETESVKEKKVIPEKSITEPIRKPIIFPTPRQKIPAIIPKNTSIYELYD